MIATKRREQILAMAKKGRDDVTIACRLQCDVRVVMRVLEEAARGGADMKPPVPASRPKRELKLDWGGGRMITVPGE